ncbi:hypothetical protein SAMN05192588_0338 [Nonlabens sp. Hel1_33_55]|uniref:hypothetical protein n=1 Tax=Nonlabens sp. Hel1_33_55 TaxID=1336802 RepID=UPI000875BF28|nr:hypothetical protein [Nonlabens sp. Hel1_33_55]SCX93660.1 hypothetical protein SAMN05192588_0338 [Nonlabens sp. Hel1_33_55]
MKKSFLFKISTLIIIILITAACNTNQKSEVDQESTKEEITSPVEMSSTADDEEDDSIVNFENGRWISTEDANSGIEIRDDKWIMFYKGTDQSPRDVYDYKVERKPVNETDPDAAMITYLTISNSNETLEYALLEYNENLLSLSYVPRGNTLNYKPE